MPLRDFDDLDEGFGRHRNRFALTRRRSPTELSPEEEAGILSNIGHAAGSGLKFAGDVLDVQGSAVRNLLTGRAPVPGLLSDADPASGRDVLTHLFGAPRNIEGFHPIKHPMDALLDIAGFGTEVATDPATYESFGASALGRAGRIARRAGLLGDLGKVAGPLKGLRTARLTTTLGDLVAPRAGEAAAEHVARRSAVWDAAKQMGVDPRQVMGEKLGGAVGVGLPFADPSLVLGTGPRAVRYAQKLDNAARALQFGRIPGTNFSPGSALVRLFHAPAAGAASEVGQGYIMPQLHAAQQQAGVEARRATGQLLHQLEEHGGHLLEPTVQANLSLRKMVEGIDAPPAELESMVKTGWGHLQGMLQEGQQWGSNVHELIDPEAGYWPRFLSRMLSRNRGRAGGQVVSAFDPSELARIDAFKGIKGGTASIHAMASDPAIIGLRDAGATGAQIGHVIKGQYGHLLENAKQGDAIGERFASMSHEALESGVFGNHPLMDFAVRMQNGKEALAVQKTILSSLADPRVLDAAQKTARSSETVPLATVLRRAKFVPGDTNAGALKRLAELRGLPIDDNTINVLKNQPIPRDLADDMAKRIDAFTSPAAVNEIVSGIDSVTNFTKGMLTGIWPSFHVRNLLSGQFQNWISGNFSHRSLRETSALLKGRSPQSLLNIPAIREELSHRGLPHTHDNAADIARLMAFEHGLTGNYAGEASSMAGSLLHGAGIDELRDQIPGGIGGSRPFSWQSMVEKAAGRHPDVTWWPQRAQHRGFRGGTTNTWAPAAAGQDAGYWIESMNRIAPFLEQLRQGVKPADAAKKVLASQVDYSSHAFTPFERSVMKRAVPFYTFSRGVIPYTLRQLWEHPGGGLAMTIRAQNSMRGTGPAIPDEVADSASIPLGRQPDGSDRYITGLGLMHEEPFGFLGNGLQGAGMEFLSRLNPLTLKGPLELATGHSFFQRGPNGGRPLEDMDPTVGRIIANLTGSDEPAHILGNKRASQAAESILANSPLSRLLTTARTITDKRKWNAGLPVNLGTGVRITDVSPARRDAVLRERAASLMKELGAKSFARIYFPKEDVAQMSPHEQAQAVRLQTLMNMLAREAKRRKAEKARQAALAGVE